MDATMMTNDQDKLHATRRRFLIETAALAGSLGTVTLGIGLVLTVGPASATPESMRGAIRKVIGESPVKKGRVKVDLPPLIENGNAVALTVSSESPMTAADHVKAIHVFTEKNPQPNVVSFYLGPRAGRANISTRIRLADSQKVIAIVQMSDGSFWSDEVEVIVTLAACLEGV
jgi:sulfur-oxidizing protein SoxY